MDIWYVVAVEFDAIRYSMFYVRHVRTGYDHLEVFF